MSSSSGRVKILLVSFLVAAGAMGAVFVALPAIAQNSGDTSTSKSILPLPGALGDTPDNSSGDAAIVSPDVAETLSWTSDEAKQDESGKAAPQPDSLPQPPPEEGAASILDFAAPDASADVKAEDAQEEIKTDVLPEEKAADTALPAAETVIMPATDTAAAASTPISADAGTLESSLSSLEVRVQALEDGLQGLRDDVSGLRKDIAKQAEDRKAAAQKSPAKASAKAPVVKKKKVEAAPKWILKSAKPGMAWVSKPNGEGLRAVTVGDSLEGIGNIMAVDQDTRGLWVVRGARGNIQQ